MGFSPPKHSLPAEPRRLSTPAALLPLSARPGSRRCRERFMADPTSGPCSPRESVAHRRGLAVRTPDAPLGFRALRLVRRRVAPGFPAAPLAGLVPLPLARERCRPLRVSIRGGGRIPEGTVSPSALLTPRFRSAHFESGRSGLAPTNRVASLLPRSVQGTSADSPGGRRRECRCQVRVAVRPSRRSYRIRDRRVKRLRQNELANEWRSLQAVSRRSVEASLVKRTDSSTK